MTDSEGCWLYVLCCADSSYYVGTTRSSPEQRLSEHRMGLHGGYTAKRRPATMLHAEHYDRITDAIAAERRLKGWSRVKKEAYIEDRHDDLPALAKRGPKVGVKADPTPSPHPEEAPLGRLEGPSSSREVPGSLLRDAPRGAPQDEGGGWDETEAAAR